MLIEILVSLFLVSGTFFVVVTAVGLLRLRDVYSRLHAVTKSATLGVALLLLASITFFAGQGESVLKEGLTIVFLFLTNPVGGHMIARSSYAVGVELWEATTIDELGEHGKFARMSPRDRE